MGGIPPPEVVPGPRRARDALRVKHPSAGPGDFERRLERARSIEAADAAAQPLAFLVRVLTHQLRRSAEPAVREAAARTAEDALPNRLVQQYPLLDLTSAAAPIAGETQAAVEELGDAAPGPLREAGLSLVARSEMEQRELVEAWLDDTSLLDPRLALWIRVTAGPILELAAARSEPPEKEEWTGLACPLCGDAPQCSVIVEESGAFLQGSPRYLVCGRCAGWWDFPRAKCPTCGEDDSRKISPYAAEDWPWARIDVCEACRGYIKTFDLREKGAMKVVPLVDDVATLALDVWAHEQGLTRQGLSLAGV
ncbi:MAG: formate dehydrogenase accessory protein FdhE [Actinobacteria bacterium]|nr:formate dehydrogenase accessory protein FdhE [Actinomycetota bacterium]